MDQRVIVNGIKAALMGLDTTVEGWQRIYLETLGATFEAHRNPITPWAALRFAREHSMEVPEWVLAYLDDRGREIQEGCSKPTSGSKSGKREAEVVGRLLGFGKEGEGQGTAASAAAYSARDWAIAVVVAAEIKRGLGPTKAAGVVAAETGKDRSTVYRAYKRYEALADQAVDKLVALAEFHE